MTNFFGLNVTKKAPSERFDGMAFCVRTASPEQSDEVDRFRRRNEEFERNTAFPFPLRIIHFLSKLIAFILIVSIIRADVSFAEGYRNAPYFYWTLLISLLVWIGVFLYRRQYLKEKQTEIEEQLAAHLANAELIYRRTMQHLSIPEDAASMDALAEHYVIKNGKPKHKNVGTGGYFNLDMFAYRENNCLYLANLETVLEIPLSSLNSMMMDKKKYCISPWNKSEPPFSERYAPYKIVNNQFDQYFVRCCRIEIRDARGDFFILIPEYEVPLFTQLTGLSPLDA